MKKDFFRLSSIKNIYRKHLDSIDQRHINKTRGERNPNIFRRVLLMGACNSENVAEVCFMSTRQVIIFGKQKFPKELKLLF